MRRLLSVAAASAVVVGPVMAATATPAAAEPTREPVKAFANTTQLSVRALSGLVEGHDALDVSIAVSQASVDSAAADQKATAEAANFSISAGGNEVPNPTAVSQSAPPTADAAAESGIDLSNLPAPVSDIVRAELFEGAARAQWNPDEGACTGSPLAQSITTVAGLGVNSGPLDAVTGPLGLGGAPLTMPGTVLSTSDVSLRSTGEGGDAVVSSSTMQVADILLFFGTPMQTQIKVVSAPTLTAVSTGDAETASVSYEAPILEVIQGGQSLGIIDAQNPTMNLPLLPGLPKQLDLGAVELSIGTLEQAIDPSGGVAANAALLDVKLLEVGGGALAHIVAGAQEVGALAPAGGVDCGSPANSPANNENGEDEGNLLEGASRGNLDDGQLAMTDAAYNPLPYVATGGLLLLVGSVLIAAVPNRRRAHAGGEDATA